MRKRSMPCSTGTPPRLGAAATPGGSRSLSHTGSRQCAWPTSSSCSTAPVSPRSARTTNSRPRVGTTRNFTTSRPRRTADRAFPIEARNLAPAPPASRLTLLRRAYFDLIGLAPAPDEIERFANDNRPEAYTELIERLLASPQYGECWARHWLDVARYADTGGFEHDFLYPNAWRYRDYVIRAFNADKSFDRFIQEQ